MIADETLAPIGATNYMGNYNFGSASTNPLDSGNGYANMLLGAPCQRIPVHSNGYCPSHQHLAATEEVDERKQEMALAA